MLFKVTGDDLLLYKGEFVDTVTLATQTIITFGKCDLYD